MKFRRAKKLINEHQQQVLCVSVSIYKYIVA